MNLSGYFKKSAAPASPMAAVGTASVGAPTRGGFHKKAMNHLSKAHAMAGDRKGALAVHLKLAKHALSQLTPDDEGMGTAV